MLAITDVVRNGSYVIYTDAFKEVLSSGFNNEAFEQMTYIDGLVSRKKQIVPAILSVIE